MIMSVYEAINCAVYKLIELAEDLCGERLPEYTFRGVKFKDVLQPHIEINGKDLVIYLTSKSSEDFDEACCECAHEVIHLISPYVEEGETASTVLEEGLATYFQALIYNNWANKGFIPKLVEYDMAFTHVAQLLKLCPNAIKILRAKEPIIGRITADLITQMFPNYLPQELAQTLEKTLSQLKAEMAYPRC